MENRYDKYFWEFEGKNKDKGKQINSFLNDSFNAKISSYEVFKKEYLESICLNYHLYERKLREWVQKEVLPNFTKETLIYCYLIKLMDALILNDSDKINSIASSFKSIGLVKGVEIKDKFVVLTTENNEKVKVKKLFDDMEIRNKFRGKCHNGCEFLIKKHEKLKEDSYVIMLDDKYAGKYSIYHSVLLKGKFIIDPARNIVMKLDDYNKLFNPNIIMCIAREPMLEEIDRLREIDADFSNSNLNDVLKLAINRQIKRN